MPYDFAGAVRAGYSAQEITDYLKDNPEHVTNYDFAGALKAGISPDAIVDALNPKADKLNVKGIPILAPIDRGIAHLREGQETDASKGLWRGLRVQVPQPSKAELGEAGNGSFALPSAPAVTAPVAPFCDGL